MKRRWGFRCHCLWGSKPLSHVPVYTCGNWYLEVGFGFYALDSTVASLNYMISCICSFPMEKYFGAIKSSGLNASGENIKE